MAEPTAECVRRAQAGDPQALSDLIMGQQHYVYSIAMSVLHQPEDAADLTQEAFIRLIRVLPQYSGESRFTTWLYRLVVNLCRDELRRRGRQVPTLPPSEHDEQANPVDLIADDDRSVDPLRALSDNELRAVVRQALNQLEDHYRLALTLYYFDDLKYTDIAEILDLTVEQAHAFFAAVPTLQRKLQTLLDVGLGYLRLGQSATTLSGGEAQRVKLAQELSKRDTGRTLYILDEPTTGLHFADIELLLQVLHRLRDAGNTIVVIEHNLDVIKTADWIIDMGPEGGAGGGTVVTCGTPEAVAAHPDSHTGRYLARVLARG